jgi:hypothetical protein
MQRPPVKHRGLPPAFMSDKATLTFSSTRDSDGERVVLVSWHEDDGLFSQTSQMQLSALDVERLRDFCDAWLALVPPTEPREAA